METRGTFSSGTDASPAAEWLSWRHKHVHCQVMTLLPRCQVLWLQGKIKCGASKWDSNTWSASNGLASRESPASGNQDNCQLCATFIVDLPAGEWVPFIKVNSIAFLCGSAMQSLWLEGFYQQNNVGKGSWNCKAMAMLACLGVKWMQRDGGYLPNSLLMIHLFIRSASEQLLYCYATNWPCPIKIHYLLWIIPKHCHSYFRQYPRQFQLAHLRPPISRSVYDCPGFWIAILYHDNSPVFVFLLNLDMVPLILFSKGVL